MAGYSKLHSSIATSSLLALPVAARWLWCFLLSQADAQGVVEGSTSGLAIAANISQEDCQAALNVFCAPDPDSRTKDEDGRRLLPVDGGWQIVSYHKWRFKLSQEERRAYKRVHEQKRRARTQASGSRSTATVVDGLRKKHGGTQ
jgi:hypothetical protein